MYIIFTVAVITVCLLLLCNVLIMYVSCAGSLTVQSLSQTMAVVMLPVWLNYINGWSLTCCVVSRKMWRNLYQQRWIVCACVSACMCTCVYVYVYSRLGWFTLG